MSDIATYRAAKRSVLEQEIEIATEQLWETMYNPKSINMERVYYATVLRRTLDNYINLNSPLEY